MYRSLNLVDLGLVLSCIYVCVFTTLIDLAMCLVCIGFVCLDVSFLTFCFVFIICGGFFPFCLVLSISPSCGIPARTRTHHVLHVAMAYRLAQFSCGAGSSGGALSAINVAPCVFR